MLDYSMIDNSLRALAEPTRRAIFDRLSRGQASVSEIAGPFDITLAAVVQHIQVLETCGLVRSAKVGRVRVCQADTRGLNALGDWIAERRSLIERRLDRLAQILDEADEIPDDLQ
ncbi:MAG: winged helix-turn-helix transcriptional regulator [Sphingomonas sp.]|nr:winged helix-turn-helix transcriptional regulator [Sphingomonas sp.]